MTFRKNSIILALSLMIALLPLGAVAAQTDARVGVFTEYAVPPQTRVEVPIEIRGVQNLYAIDVELRYDPALLDFEDADPATEGVQPGLGTFLDAGMVLFNTVDPQTGIVRFVMTQVNPAEPKSGDGVILVLYFVAKAEGVSNLAITGLTLSDREGVAIPASPVDSKIEVETGKPQPQATSIPVQNPTALIIIPTMAPTNTPAPTQVPTPTSPAPSATVAQPTQAVPAVVAQAPTSAPAGTTGFSEVKATSGGQSRVVWIAVVAVAVIGGLLLKRRLSGKPAAPAEVEPAAPVIEEAPVPEAPAEVPPATGASEGGESVPTPPEDGPRQQD